MKAYKNLNPIAIACSRPTKLDNTSRIIQTIPRLLRHRVLSSSSANSKASTEIDKI